MAYSNSIPFYPYPTKTTVTAPCPPYSTYSPPHPYYTFHPYSTPLSSNSYPSHSPPSNQYTYGYPKTITTSPSPSMCSNYGYTPPPNTKYRGTSPCTVLLEKKMISYVEFFSKTEVIVVGVSNFLLFANSFDGPKFSNYK